MEEALERLHDIVKKKDVDQTPIEKLALRFHLIYKLTDHDGEPIYTRGCDKN